MRLLVPAATLHRRVTIKAVRQYRGQDPPIHVVDTRRIGGVAARGFGQRLIEKDLLVELRARLLIKPVKRCRQPWHSAPVGHHETFVPPVALEHLVEEIIAVAGLVAVNLIIRAHNRSRPATLDADLKREQVTFAGSAVGNPRIDKIPSGFLTVQGEVLDRRDHMVRLDACNRSAGQHAGQQRVFREILECPAVAWIAHQICPAGEQNIEPLGPRLDPDHGSGPIEEFRIPGRRHGDARRQGCCATIAAQSHDIGNAQARIGFGKRRDFQAGYTRHITRTRNGFGRNFHTREKGNGNDAMGQHQFLVRRHLRYNLCRALFSGGAVGGRASF